MCGGSARDLTHVFLESEGHGVWMLLRHSYYLMANYVSAVTYFSGNYVQRFVLTPCWH